MQDQNKLKEYIEQTGKLLEQEKNLQMEESLLESGETAELTQRQDRFNQLFEECEEFEEEPDSTLWTLYMDGEDAVDEKQIAIFLDKVEEIGSIPPYKYVIRYLFKYLHIPVPLESMENVWKYIEDGNGKINADLTEKEINAFYKKGFAGDEIEAKDIVDAIFSILKIRYEENGNKKKDKWSAYSWKLLKKLDGKLLTEFAFGIKMNYEDYKLFRKKVLRQSSINFFRREEIFTYLVLNYAKICQCDNYYSAYESLEMMYPVEKKDVEQEELSTREISDWFRTFLSDSEGHLKEEYRGVLFQKRNSEIAEILCTIDSYKRKQKKRSAEKEFLEQWDCLEENILTFERDCVSKEELAKQMEEEGYFGKQKIYRWLYGEKVYKRLNNRNMDIKDKQMVILRKEKEGYFLDSKVFLDTRIRDNTFSAFPLDEERQRNLLLTLTFLNYVLDSEDLSSDSYEDRIMEFEWEVHKTVRACGFQGLYSGNAYDAYLKLLLSCDSPLELFRYIWRMKTSYVEE